MYFGYYYVFVMVIITYCICFENFLYVAIGIPSRKFLAPPLRATTGSRELYT
jgi:hypothetical protein